MITKTVNVITGKYYVVNYSKKTDNFDTPMGVRKFKSFELAEMFLSSLGDKLGYGLIIEAKEIAHYRNK